MPKFEGDIPRSFALKPMVVWLDKVWTWLAVASDLFRLTACPLHCHPSVLPWICLGFLLGFCWALFLFELCAIPWTYRSVLIQSLFAQAPPVSRTRLARCLDWTALCPLVRFVSSSGNFRMSLVLVWRSRSSIYRFSRGQSRRGRRAFAGTGWRSSKFRELESERGFATSPHGIRSWILGRCVFGDIHWSDLPLCLLRLSFTRDCLESVWPWWICAFCIWGALWKAPVSHRWLIFGSRFSDKGWVRGLLPRCEDWLACVLWTVLIKERLKPACKGDASLLVLTVLAFASASNEEFDV